jgi:hypothetical protein
MRDGYADFTSLAYAGRDRYIAVVKSNPFIDVG